MKFADRIEAGRQLGRRLEEFRGDDTVVCGLPRGGMVVAAEVARYLDAPLGVILCKKVTHPLWPELALGAVTESGVVLWDAEQTSGLVDTWRDVRINKALDELRRKRVDYTGDQLPISYTNKLLIVVDDGVATGYTLLAGLREALLHGPRHIVAAVPVMPRDLPLAITEYANEVIALEIPDEPFEAVGKYYHEFSPVTDEEVRRLLGAYRHLGAEEPLDLESLNSILATVTQYPVSGESIARRARRLAAPANVVQFFETIPADRMFANPAEIVRISEETSVMMDEEERDDGTPEHLKSYDDA